MLSSYKLTPMLISWSNTKIPIYLCIDQILKNYKSNFIRLKGRHKELEQPFGFKNFFKLIIFVIINKDLIWILNMLI